MSTNAIEPLMNPIEERLARARAGGIPPAQMAEEAIALAADLLAAAQRQITPRERASAAQLARMMDDPKGKAMTLAMNDQIFRSDSPRRTIDQLSYLVDQFGVPKYLLPWERVALGAGARAGRLLPGVVVPQITNKLRNETAAVLVPGEEAPFTAYLAERRASGTRLNLNRLGEAILGDEEAGQRFAANLELLSRPDIEYISVKISNIFSQINLVAFDATVAAIQERLRALYRTAMQHQYVAVDGTSAPKFVNLDMEEYKDLALTVAAFTRTLDEPEFLQHRAGLVLQAYLPDAFPIQRQVTDWAKTRVARGGAPVKVRIVKGANLAMERVDAEWHGWALAPYGSKHEVDANYKRMVAFGCQPENARAVNLGVASHNLFDIALALLHRAANAVEAHVEFEMLEGMANHQARAVRDGAGGLLLYAPVVKREDFHSAIAYLVRRLDENTAPENFLHDVFGLTVGSPEWDKQRTLFLAAMADMDSVASGPQRLQNRAHEPEAAELPAQFANAPDTDWSLRHNVDWISPIVQRWKDTPVADVPLQINGNIVPLADDRVGEGEDPSRPDRVAYRHALATPEQVSMALDCAVTARGAWSGMPTSERRAILLACGRALGVARGELIGAMVLDGGKTIAEADAEVSEAVDFANYYARTFDAPESAGSFVPLGTVLITPPWNFPLAIPAGGVLAALMAGNTVILKPAPEAVLVARELCNVLWSAGVPMTVLQFVPTTDDEVGRALVTDDRVSAVILTGAYATARMFLKWKPSLKLFAETSGKNCTIVSAMADRDQAVRDLVRSAFGHNGQKCSATSLAVLEAEVYDSAVFMRQLRDAAASLKVGGAWDAASSMTPLIREPGPDLARALTTLDEGETWLLQPQRDRHNPRLWSPGIKLGVKRGSWFQRTECFGPVLGLVRAQSFAEAVDIVNDSALGLTSGLQSLDDREVASWRETIGAGNLYINRGTTGAIVQRQPFGGWKRSVFGEAKAGGPNYVASLGHAWGPVHAVSQDVTLPDGTAALVRSLLTALPAHEAGAESMGQTARAWQQAWNEHFAVEHDPSGLRCEQNVFRYRAVRQAIVRVETGAQLLDGMRAVLAARICGVPVVLSLLGGISTHGMQGVAGVTVHVEDVAGLEVRLRSGACDRLRCFGGLFDATHAAAHEGHVLVCDEPMLAGARRELRHYLREQTVTQTMHRYGNIAVKG